MPRTTFAPAAASLLMALASVGAQAQNVYRIVGPDGKVTFSDRPPAETTAPPARSPAAPAAATASPAAVNGALPYELRQVANRYPVTIYTGNDCAPCGSLRNMLTSRGVPYTERTVASNEDIAALQRLSGSTSLPFGTIGGQQLVGFSDAEWIQYLDAAGYPKQSQLPSNYRQPAPTPWLRPSRWRLHPPLNRKRRRGPRSLHRSMTAQHQAIPPVSGSDTVT